ncbi:polysaccharide deacetylase family protein [Aurantimonas sp. VKM B-3413]|uniref:polysaccharide deacetylase family protein n=1 Tax=Aurantimonas sp. VKM B-3413 TaxID=2779401 RepID=UPI001E28C5E2|nr:polysaccharide deacetylase family protein [Aurantimonas sp. VKM B-3413]MCB8837292.1 polysaccharide deacetylase family protein [Aurantimonas sp. VKM B-3413]
MRLAQFVMAAAASSLLAGCASNQAASLARPQDPAGKVAALGFAGEARGADAFPLYQSFRPVSHSALNGRTIAVARISDIALRPKEVVLTFDDGPMPGKTSKILETLDDYGVGATFLMVGEMAHYHPDLVREVAQHGHTIGTHTYRHANLRTMSPDAAMAEIRKGQASVAEALAPIGRRPAPFFRFPYLADTQSLRKRLASEGITTIDVDIDSKDYFRSSAESVRSRALDAVEKHGRGIILMHDIQTRTAAMLPQFLADLKSRGYTVVRLSPADRSAPLVASAE